MPPYTAATGTRMPPYTAATETKMTHFSTPRHLELLPCLSIEIVPYYNHELDEERTGIVVCFSWLTETWMWEWV